MSHTLTARPAASPTVPRRLLLIATAVLIAVTAVALAVLWIATSGESAPSVPAVVDRSGSVDVPARTPSTRYPGTVPAATTAVSLVDSDWEPCRPNLPC